MATTARTLLTEVIGKATIRLLQTPEGYAGVIIHGQAKPVTFEGSDPDELWRKLRAEVGKAHPSYFGYDGARARFLGYFPDAFDDAGYLTHERRYKDDAVARIGAMAPIEAARRADQAECVQAVRAFQATNLVFPVEKSRIKEVLAGATGPAFLRAAARFADGEVTEGLDAMISAIKPVTSPSWPMLTYLPFMWRPDRHLFLKPVVTCDFADRVGHPFGREYKEGLVAGIYECLLDLGAETKAQIASLNPKDLIDVQSFIWVVGAYKEDEIIDRGAPAK